jgi:hypothetical protein
MKGSVQNFVQTMPFKIDLSLTITLKNVIGCVL